MSSSRRDRRRKYWGWGWEDESLTAAESKRLAALLQNVFGMEPEDRPTPPPPEALTLPAPRLAVPGSLACPVSQTAHARLTHAGGKSYLDLVRMRRESPPPLPDLVLWPGSVEEIVETLEWADRAGATVVPFGGGTSVTGGVEPRRPDGEGPVVSLDLTRMNRVRVVDETSRLALVEGGLLGPELEAALEPVGLAFRHYPQSYLFSTVGGWVATRSGGHYSTLLGKIEERVAGLEVIAPDGRMAETRPLPAGSIGPDPNRFWIGSEGTLGILSAVWLRCVPVPSHRSACSIRFGTFEEGLEAVRAIVQAGLHPTHLRLLDPFEAMISTAFSGVGKPVPRARLICGFEGEARVESALEEAVRLARRHGGEPTDGGNGAGTPAENWKNLFFRQPYLRDELIGWGLLVDTFETAVPWAGAHELYEAVREVTNDALLETCGTGAVWARTTHAYPDGVAFYFSFCGKAERGREEEQWLAVKTAATDAVLAHGGTTSHHHACGRDHVPWASRELPDVWWDALRGAKKALDPTGMMNPGVLWDDERG